ncbi:MAG TPA: FlgD immunoglobulin-like domain containing protein [Candidatus Eisenbacteria bacterium]
MPLAIRRAPLSTLLPSLVLVLVCGPAGAQSFTNFESHQLHPLALSADGSRLFACNTPDNRLSVYQLTPAGPVLEAEIPVGLEPVSVAPRTANEVWVVNHLSDDITIVDLVTMNVRASIPVGDEPTDVVFAGPAGRAFVVVSQEDAVRILDPANPAQPATVVPLFGSDPRAIAASADGSRVYVSVFESGNNTSILSTAKVGQGGGPPAPNPPRNPALPPPPPVGLVIGWNGLHWVDETGTKNWETLVPIPYSLPDNDLIELDAAQVTPVPRYFTGVGTLNYNLSVNPVDGRVYVPNFAAFNLTRFEPKLRGRFGQYRVSIIDPGPATVTPVNLNPHINTAITPGPPSEIALSLSQVNGGDWSADGQSLYLAALGSGTLAVVNPSGVVTARVAVGQGPTAVQVDDARGLVYVLNRFTNTVATVDRNTLTVTGETSLGYQPEPAAIVAGRKFLYDARLSSGHGDLACASCHAFGNLDALAWDLGDPTGTLAPAPPGFPAFHPMKGPMTTQSLRGLAGTAPFHWRGDRADFTRFNPAFVSLMGKGDTLATVEMQAYADFILTVSYPPNPNQNLDRSLPNPPAPAGSAERGRLQFTGPPHDGPLTCQACHNSAPPNQPFLVSPGTNRLLIPAQALQESQAFKVPHLRNLYEKRGFRDAAGPQKNGFGFIHDGSSDTIVNFLLSPVFQFANNQQRVDLEAFMHAFDTGLAPAIGAQQTVDGTNGATPAVTARLNLLIAQADAGAIDLVVKGRASGQARGWFYVGGGQYESDGVGEPLVTTAELMAGAAAGAERTWTGVPPGAGERIGIDRDLDGYGDRHELSAGSNPADPNSIPSTSTVGGPVDGPGGRVPTLAASPNPAGPAGTEISFTLADAAEVSLEIFDLSGRRVATLLDGRREQGTVTVHWDGRDDSGRPMAGGVYFSRLAAAGASLTRKIVLAP